MSVRVLNFGCRLNTWEGEVMRGHAQAAGLADTIIVNTCAVTAEAERQARQAVRRARRENPEARIVVTGCAAQIRPEAWSGMTEVDRVVGNQEKLEAATWAAHAHPRVAVSDIMAAREAAAHLVTEFAGRLFSDFKPALADLAVAHLAPITARMSELMSDPAEIDRILGQGADRAAAISEPILAQTHDIVGLLRSR